MIILNKHFRRGDRNLSLLIHSRGMEEARISLLRKGYAVGKLNHLSIGFQSRSQHGFLRLNSVGEEK